LGEGGVGRADVTAVGTGLPLTYSVTVLPVPVVCTALVGTVVTPTTWLMTTLTDADIPGRSAGFAPLRTTVTGKVATPDVTVAASATEDTLPETAALDPAATTCAACPPRSR